MEALDLDSLDIFEVVELLEQKFEGLPAARRNPKDFVRGIVLAASACRKHADEIFGLFIRKLEEIRVEDRLIVFSIIDLLCQDCKEFSSETEALLPDIVALVCPPDCLDAVVTKETLARAFANWKTRFLVKAEVIDTCLRSLDIDPDGARLKIAMQNQENALKYLEEQRQKEKKLRSEKNLRPCDEKDEDEFLEMWANMLNVPDDALRLPAPVRGAAAASSTSSSSPGVISLESLSPMPPFISPCLSLEGFLPSNTPPVFPCPMSSPPLYNMPPLNCGPSPYHNNNGNYPQFSTSPPVQSHHNHNPLYMMQQGPPPMSQMPPPPMSQMPLPSQLQIGPGGGPPPPMQQLPMPMPIQQMPPPHSQMPPQMGQMGQMGGPPPQMMSGPPPLPPQQLSPMPHNMRHTDDRCPPPHMFEPLDSPMSMHEAMQRDSYPPYLSPPYQTQFFQSEYSNFHQPHPDHSHQYVSCGGPQRQPHGGMYADRYCPYPSLR